MVFLEKRKHVYFHWHTRLALSLGSWMLSQSVELSKHKLHHSNEMESNFASLEFVHIVHRRRDYIRAR